MSKVNFYLLFTLFLFSCNNEILDHIDFKNPVINEVLSDWKKYNTQIILTEVKTPDDESFELKREENRYNLISENHHYVITNNYSLKKAKILYDEILVNITLSDYDEATGAPHKQHVEVSGVADFLFVTKYSKIQFDNPQKFSFNIPKNYEQTP